MTDPTPEPTPVDEIVVIGVRPEPGMPKYDTEQQQEVDPNPEPGGGGGVWTEGEVEAEAERQKECAAKAYEGQLNEKHSDQKGDKEFFSLIWNRSGETVTHSPRGGTSDRITGTEIAQTMSDFGISGSDILGYSHNHPPGEYCTSTDALGFDEVRANAYPSENDWNDAIVPASSRSNVTPYILGCDDQMRSFRYVDRAKAERDRDQRAMPPDPITPEACDA